MSVVLISSVPLFSAYYSGRRDIGSQELFDAIDNEDVTQVASLLKRRIDPNVMRKGKTALLQAIALPDEKVAKQIVGLLLEYGVDPNISDDSGMTPLVFARYVEKPQIVLLLLQHGATVTGHKTLREEKARNGKCPYEKALKKLAKEFYFVPEEEEEEWTFVEKPETAEEEWEILRSKL